MTETPAADQAMDLQYRNFPAFDETAQANRKVLTDALDKLAEGDADAFWDIFDPEVTFYEASCLPYGGAHEGLEATKQGYAFLCEHFSNMRAEFEAVLASRDIVILYQTITFEVAANGNTGTLPVAELFRFRGGKVVEWRAHYFDACMVANALKG
ncbi:MAG: nuclear transport factor 2 family protein [Novosphingobium sp.]|nr:nuclear transport factor 2 family protein [Novosphingobium sp.]MCP5402130.1 nuclear transport factor 2 family protein [Novosphingobium sp.]